MCVCVCVREKRRKREREKERRGSTWQTLPVEACSGPGHRADLPLQPAGSPPLLRDNRMELAEVAEEGKDENRGENNNPRREHENSSMGGNANTLQYRVSFCSLKTPCCSSVGATCTGVGGRGWRTSYGRHQSARGVTATGAWRNSEEVSEWRRKPQAGGGKAERGSALGAQVQSQCVLTRVSTSPSCDPAGGPSCWSKKKKKSSRSGMCAHHSEENASIPFGRALGGKLPT